MNTLARTGWLRVVLLGGLGAAFVVLDVAACGGGDCTPGRATSCACPSGQGSGVQVCGDDGVYEACDCSGGAGGGGTTSSSVVSSVSSSVSSSVASSSSTGGGTCMAPSKVCGGQCIDVLTSEAHCGDCDNDCPATATCVAGECQCPGGQAFCDGACIGVQTDEENCGGCDHACDEGDSCVGGLCPSDILATSQNLPYGLAVDEGNVYWTSEDAQSRVLRTDFAGATPEVLATNQIRPRKLALHDGKLYWANFGSGSDNGQIVMLDLPDGDPEVLVDNQDDGLWGIHVTDTHVWWTNQLTFTIMRTSFTTPANVDIVVSNQATPWDVVTTATHVYWTNYDSNDVRRAQHSGLSQQTLAENQGKPLGIAVDDTHVYWASESGEIRKKLHNGTGNVIDLATAQPKPTYLAVDDTHVYWTNFGNGSVAKAPKNGGAVTILAIGQEEPYSIVVDDDYVYWSNLASDPDDTMDGSIMRVAK